MVYKIIAYKINNENASSSQNSNNLRLQSREKKKKKKKHVKNYSWGMWHPATDFQKQTYYGTIQGRWTNEICNTTMDIVRGFITILYYFLYTIIFILYYLL